MKTKATMSDEEFENVYKAAQDADNEYSKAICRQFGARASRWGVRSNLYNEETLAAFNKKKNLDNAVVFEMRRRGNYH